MTTKTKFRISQIFGIIFIVFWQVETWYFIIRDGWHTKAITESEKICDNIAFMFLLISFIFFLSILYDMVKLFAMPHVVKNPSKLEPVLAKIEHINSLGKSSWYEVVYFDKYWRTYDGSSTFSDGEKVVKWKYCKDLL